MKKTKELKKHVLERLVCCWGESCAVFFIILGDLLVIALAVMLAYDYLVKFSSTDFPVWLAALITALLAAGLWLAVAPFAYGVRWYRIQQVRGNTVFARSMFSCYTSLKKLLQVLKLNSMLTLRRFPSFILICGAVAAEFYMVNEAGKVVGQDSFLYTASAALMLLLAAIGFCLFLVLSLKYAPVPYLYALEPDSSPKEIIAKSKRLMKNNSRYIVETMCSMTGWLAPCLLIFPMIFIVPYFQMVYTAAINEIIEQDAEKENIADDERQFISNGI
ncbi:MAG: DUF975 family protein [Oscillospiraceae bacterium]|nr:DUF975 family protein [Oscillospiraceae bacterium]MDE6132812.1 DUF975 family protein [Oscillospiraceae bacterium]